MAHRLQNLKSQRFYEVLPEADAQFYDRTGQHNSAALEPDPFQQNPYGQGPDPDVSTQHLSPGAQTPDKDSLYSKSLYDAKSLRAESFATQETRYAPVAPQPVNVAAGVHDGIPAHWKPQRLHVSMWWRILRLTFDILSAGIALLFTVFGFMVLQQNGKSADTGTLGYKLYQISQYAPTVFPVIFAGLVGNSMKAIITWCLQNPKGARVQTVEQIVGSQSMLRAFMTQFRLRAFNPLGILTILLWCLSPLGSQASLRVISIVKSYPSHAQSVVGLYNFAVYGYSSAEAVQLARTEVASPVIASMMAASLLGTRNQDLWGNVRFPQIEPLETAAGNITGMEGSNTTTTGSWLAFEQPANTNLTYMSLVGQPVGKLGTSGNTSFVFPGSYIKVTCPVFGKREQETFTNVSSDAMEALLPEDDCNWDAYTGGSWYQVAITSPCESYSQNMSSSNTRKARKFLWETMEGNGVYTHALCHLTTTFIEANVTCTGNPSTLSAKSECKPTRLRRANTLGLDSNWTSLDIATSNAAVGVLTLMTDLFPSTSATYQSNFEPLPNYIVNPYTAIISSNSERPAGYSVGRATFEVRMAQILNTIINLGNGATDMTGAFDYTNPAEVPNIYGNMSMVLNGTTTVLQDVIQCERPWLGVLVTASLCAFLVAVVASGLRMVTIIPDVIESVSLAFLPNRTRGIYGSSTWTATQWAMDKKDMRVALGDIYPGAEVGCIALAPLNDGQPIGKAQVGKMYI